MDWTQILVATIPASLVFAGVVVSQMGKREEVRTEREASIINRMDALERKLDAVQRELRSEQRFSHQMVLMLTSVVHYLRAAAVYRRRHADVLPEGLPDLPDPDEIEQLLTARPTYYARDEP